MDRYYKWLACLLGFLCITSNQALYRGPWSAWSSCSASCDGSQERTRTCQAEQGESCEGLTSESRSCSSGVCVNSSIIVAIVFGLLILLAIIVVIYLTIKRRKTLRENEEAAHFNTNAAEDYYDRSIVRSSSIGSRANTAAPSIASSRATIPTIAPYLPDVEEEEHVPQNYNNYAYDNTDSLGRVSFSNESIQEARLDFDVDEVEAVHESSSPAEQPKVTMMTFAGTQTELGDDNNDDDLAVTIDVV
ncbi:thrombospondin type-1 domain-containing protein 1-like [Actinia tenebrosa]|uniref:Thrombospondin type-1 domain-containing protein 1-like n=1 Tax=Actinia tenebrosa TaxID=6105 RepID=A0A6P8HJM4_ACTTE|nr:thrombospondin type-1 domain-containing protein 1-like [Actinia tenebrosa]